MYLGVLRFDPRKPAPLLEVTQKCALKVSKSGQMVCDNLNALAAYLASEQHLAPDSPWRINRAIAFSHLRRLLPRVLTGVGSMTSRLATALLTEIAANLQKFIPSRSRSRHVRLKPHKAHAYKPSA